MCNSPIWFDFLKLSMVQECLKHPRGHLSFLQNKIVTIVRFKCVKNSLHEYFSQIVPRYLELDTLDVGSQNNLGNSAASGTRIKTMT